MKSSTDIWFLAFLLSQGVKIHHYDTGQRSKVTGFFDLSEEEWKEYKILYSNSEFPTCKSYVEMVKDLAF